MSKRIELLVIDPQVDFCDPKRGALYVPGPLHPPPFIPIPPPIFGRDSHGQQPAPFTRISRTDFEECVWTPAVPSLYRRALEYVRKLEKNGRYELTIWPPHCLIGSPGHTVFPELFTALTEWEWRFAF